MPSYLLHLGWILYSVGEIVYKFVSKMLEPQTESFQKMFDTILICTVGFM